MAYAADPYLMASSSSPTSSEDEEEANWKAALREQVEEDLQRQVRLRLGLDRDWSVGEEEEEEGHSDTLTRHHRLHTLHTSPLHNHSPHLPKDGASVQGEEGKGVGEGKSEGRGRVGERDGRRLKPQSKGSELSRNHGDKEVFHYLSKHFGPPAKQLQQLSSCGALNTRSLHPPAEEQGSGACGGVVRWPVEAHISLPTPHHITPSQHGRQPFHESNRERGSQRSAAVGVASSSYDEIGERGRRGRGVVYVCGREGEGRPDQSVSRRDGSLLTFESRFECGNLSQAIQIGSHEYSLVLNPDLYTKKHVQWYYFRVMGVETTPTYTFHIVNFMKSDSLYNNGLQPLLYSDTDARTSGMGWRRVGWDVSYHRSSESYPPHMSPDQTYYTLSWRMQFPHPQDVCYLAHCFPYPLSALHRLLREVEGDAERGRYVKSEDLCKTLAGNVCPVLTITEFSGEGRGEEEEEVRRRKGVVITGRVHPGESNSSWMMEGVLHFLTSTSPHAKTLRSNFVFKVVPMLNPDGVVVGNYRASLAGVDLNRVYKKPLEDLFPTVFHTKQMIVSFMQEREVCVYVDLHGHSRKHNVFMYGCHQSQTDHTHLLYERILPFLLSQQSPSKFSLPSCKFAVQRCKEATGRVVTWRMGVANSFTMEATFCGSNLGPHSWQFSEADLMDMGSDLCEALYKYHKFLKSKTYQLKVLAELAETLMQSVATSQAPPPPPTPPQASILPDIITSSTPRDHPHHSHRHHSHHHHHKKHAHKVLRRFMKADLSSLLAESSTSGSDSENEDFKFRRKHKCKHRSRRRHKSLTSQTHHHLPLPPPNPHLTSFTKPQASQLTVPALLERSHHKHHSSAPARLQQTDSCRRQLPPAGASWKFVNRYANRSNGGIPMFAEERMKERIKKRLTSVSEVAHSPASPQLQPKMPTAHELLHASTHVHLHRPRPLWHPPECPPPQPPGQHQLATHPHPPTSHHPHPPTSHHPHSSSRQHYKHIKDIVEHSRQRPHPSPLHPSQAHRSQPRPAPLPALHHLPSGLPPHLISYITEIWNK